MRFILYAGTSALIIYISSSRPQRNILQLCIARANKPATHLRGSISALPPDWQHTKNTVIIERYRKYKWHNYLRIHQFVVYQHQSWSIEYIKPDIIFFSSKICCHWSGLRKVKCLVSDVPGKTQFFSRHFLFFPCHICKKFCHLLSLSVIFADISVIFRHFLRICLVPGRQKVPGSLLQGPTFSQALSLFSNYAPIVLLTPPLKLFFSSRFCSQRQPGQLKQIFAVWRKMTIIAGTFIYINETGGGKGYILMIFLARCHENN